MIYFKCSNPHYVSRLCSFFVLIQFVLYCLAFVQGLKSIRLDDGEMNKDVGRNFGVNNEPEAFLLVKPLDCAFSHTIDIPSQPPGFERQLERLKISPKLSVRLEKAPSISRSRQKRQEDSNTFISSRIRLAFFISDSFLFCYARFVNGRRCDGEQIQLGYNAPRRRIAP